MLAWIVGGLVAIGGIFLAISLRLHPGWSGIVDTFGIDPLDQPSAGDVQWFSSIFASLTSVRDIGMGPLFPLVASGDDIALRASVSDAGLYLRPRWAIGRLARPILLPWNVMAVREHEPGRSVVVEVNDGQVQLMLRGDIAGAIVGRARRLNRSRGDYILIAAAEH